MSIATGSRDYRIFDKATEIRSITATAITVTTSEVGLAIALTALEPFEVIIDAAAYTGYAAGTAEWVLTLEVSDTLGSGYVTTESFIPNGTATQRKMPLSRQYINAIKPNAKFIRVTATKTGAPGALSYGAYLNPLC